MTPVPRFDPDDPYPDSDGAPLVENTLQFDWIVKIKEKLDFYDTHGAAEYYLYDPARNRLEVWLRQDGRLAPVAFVNGWTSPRLGIRFALRAKTLEIFDPAGQPFLSPLELARRAREAEARAAQADARVQQADARAEQERVRAEQERARAEALAERLRALGIDH